MKVVNDDLLLYGQGSDLVLVETPKSVTLQQRCAFEDSAQAIHGIALRPEGEGLVWGGRTFALAVLDDTDLSIESHGSAPDWIVDAALVHTETRQGVIGYILTAHNELLALHRDTQSDTVSPKLCIEVLTTNLSCILYSGHILLISEDHVLIAAGTAFGEIVVWSCKEETSGSENSASLLTSRIHHVYRGHTGSIFGIHITDEIGTSGTSKRYLLSCSDDRTIKVWPVDVEHVQLEYQDNGQHYKTGFDLARIGGTDQFLGSVFGHQSRIWSVKSLPMAFNNDKDVFEIVSCGEDATCQTWGVSVTDHTDNILKITPKYADNHHSGKHIWSSDVRRTIPGTVIYTGGADGQVIRRTVLSYEHCKVPESTNGSLKHFCLLTESTLLAVTGHGVLLRGELRAYLNGPEIRGLTASTVSGTSTLSGNLTEKHCASPPHCFSWSQVQIDDLGTNAIIAAIPNTGFALIRATDGRLFRYDGELQIAKTISPDSEREGRAGLFPLSLSNEARPLSSTTSVSDFVMTGGEPQRLIHAYTTQKALGEDRHQIFCGCDLPPDFVVTAAATGGSEILLVIGSRAGALAFYTLDYGDTLTLRACFRHVHGKDAVTSITHLLDGAKASNGISALHQQVHCFLTTGRDSTYAIHRLLFEPLSSNASLETLHRSSPPFGLYIEGAFLLEPNHSKSDGSFLTSDLCVYGFRSRNFVVWNETRQQEIFSVECGGAHRSWSFCPNETGGGTFVWTQAGKTHMYRQEAPACQIVKTGSHGREIKAAAIAPSQAQQLGEHSKNDLQLFATGAEDTCIRLWHYSLSRKTFHHLTTIDRHSTGVQHLQFSPYGNFLLSSGGAEELHLWQIHHDVPLVRVGVTLEATVPRSEHAVDLRITSFDVREDHPSSSHADLDFADSRNLRGLVIAAVYSDSSFRVFKYAYPSTAHGGGAIFTLHAGIYDANCLTQIILLPTVLSHVDDSKSAITAGTDGHIAIWSLSKPSDISDSVMTPQMKIKVQQNSIKAMLVVPLHSDHENPCRFLTITAGDDNALGLTLLSNIEVNTSESDLHRQQQPRSETANTSNVKPERKIKTKNNRLRLSASSPTPAPASQIRACPYEHETLLLPIAHAASITALALLSSCLKNQRQTILFASTGNDQVVRIWKVDIDLGHLSKKALEHPDQAVTLDQSQSDRQVSIDTKEHIRIRCIKECWTSVADVGAMEVLWKEETRSEGQGRCEAQRVQAKLLLTGVGMEVLDVAVDMSGE